MDTSNVLFREETDKIMYVLRESKIFQEHLSGGARYNTVWNYINSTLYFMNMLFQIVHHINGNPTDDVVENLELMTRKKHGELHHPKKVEEFICPQCGGYFELKGNKLSNYKSNKKRNKNMKGPFCCKECAGRGSVAKRQTHRA